MSKTVLLLACCVLLVLAAPVWADEDDTETPETELPDLTVQAQRLNESADDPSVFIEIIEMDQYAGRMVSTEDVLRQAAGVNIRSFGGVGSFATISVRGSSADQVVVLVDGVRVNSAVGGGVDLSQIPPSQIERIEIIRGGGSAMYGEGAVGGVVNIVTRRGSGENRRSASVTHGSFNTWRLTGSMTGGQERWNYLAAGSYLHSNGDYRFTNDRGTTLDESDDFIDVRRNNELDARNMLLRLAYTPSEGCDLTLHNDLYSADAGVPGIVTFPSPNVHQKLLRDLSSLSVALTGLGLPGLRLRTRLANRYEWSRYRDGHGEQTGVPLVSDREEVEPTVEQVVEYVWGAHQIITLTGLYSRSVLREDEYDNPERDTWAASLRDQVLFWDGRLTLVGAIRYDDVEGIGDQWSPKGGLSLKPWPWLTIKGNLGRSFRAPSFSELYFNHGFVQGNPDLQPERAVHYDAGLQFHVSRLSLEGAYFRSDVSDLIEYELISGFRYKPFNIGRARLEGGEWSGRFSPVSYLVFSGAYTLTYAIDTTEFPNRGDRQIPGRPRHVAFGRLETPVGIFCPFAEFNYVSGNFITAANTKLLDERRIWNMGLIIMPVGEQRLSLEMKNALDEELVDVRGFPLPGRAMYLTYEASF